MIHAGLALAQRLESAEALIGAACASVGSAILEVAGGTAIFAGIASPLTHAVALGMRGPVRAADIDRMEDFYRVRGATPSIELCPLADASLIELLGARGYRITEFNNMLVRSLTGADFNPSRMVRLANSDEDQIWSRTVGRGFLEKDDLSPEEMEIGGAIWHMPGARCYLAFHDTRVAAGAAMAVNSGLATLFADSTMMGFRGAGLQSALIRERLRAAQAEGCDMATASVLAGSVSQRNYERNGFTLAYTKATLVL
jgi:hypothetical protein